MPTAEEAVKRGSLSEAARKVLEVITIHDKYVFSTALEDLSQLAKWCVDPATQEPSKLSAQDSTESITINTKFEVLVRKDGRSQTVPTYTLRTLSTALASLARTDRIWRGKLFFSDGREKKGRIYYGAKGIEAELNRIFERLGPSERFAQDWITLTPGEAGDEN